MEININNNIKKRKNLMNILIELIRCFMKKKHNKVKWKNEFKLLINAKYDWSIKNIKNHHLIFD